VSVLEKLVRVKLEAINISSTLAAMLEAIGFAILLAVGRMVVVVVPWSPVPFTLQTMRLSKLELGVL